MDTTHWTVWVDHGYEGEKNIPFEGTREEAQAKAAEYAADPYVMRTDVHADRNYPSAPCQHARTHREYGPAGDPGYRYFEVFCSDCDEFVESDCTPV